MKKILLILIFGHLFYACGNKDPDGITDRSIRGKWKSTYQSELWIDQDHIFYGNDDWPSVAKCSSKGDSIISENSFGHDVRSYRVLTADTIIIGDEKYFRVADGIPEIADSEGWVNNALKEIVIRRATWRVEQNILMRK